jgi:hypothetical protein
MYGPAKIPLPKDFMPRHPFDNSDLEVRDEMLALRLHTPEAMRRHIADYYVCITCLDHHIGRVLAAAGPANTIMLFTGGQGLAVIKSPLLIAGPGVRHVPEGVERASLAGICRGGGKPVREHYPWELDDLSRKPAHAAKFAAMKQQLAAEQDRFDDRFAPRPTV